MRIAVWYNLPPGGARRALYHHVKGLVERGHHVEAWRPDIPKFESPLIEIGELVDVHTLPYETRGASQSTYLARVLAHGLSQDRRIEAMHVHSAQCSKQMQERGFDVLLAANCAVYAAPFIGRHFAGRKVLYLQDPIRPFYEAKDHLIWRLDSSKTSGQSLKSRWIGKVKAHLAFRDSRQLADEEYQNAAAFDEILVNSYFSRETILRAYGLESRVCYLGIDPLMFQPKAVEKEPFVIGVGLIDKPKRIEFVIEALATVGQRRPKLVWIGQIANAEYRSRLQRLANDVQVQCEFRVAINDHDLVNALSMATAMVYAPQLEPFGFAPLEANACGTPAICIAEGGMRESIKPGVNGLLVDPAPAALGAAISQLIENPEYARSLGESARAHVLAEWTWDRSVDILEERLGIAK